MSDTPFWKKALSTVVDFEEARKASSPPVQSSSPSVAVAASTVSQSIPEAYDQAMLDTLQKVVNSRKTPYTALVDASERMRSVIVDDSTRLKAAFTMITADGRSLETIIQAIDLHVADVNSELTRFKASSEQAISSKVSVLRTQSNASLTARDQALASIDNLQKQIIGLQQQAAEYEAKATELSNQANQAEAEILTIATKFNNAVEFVKQDLLSKKTSLITVLQSKS